MPLPWQTVHSDEIPRAICPSFAKCLPFTHFEFEHFTGFGSSAVLITPFKVRVVLSKDRAAE